MQAGKRPNPFSIVSLLSGMILMTAVFLVEINTGVLAGTVAYVLIVVLVLWFYKSHRLTLILGAFTSILILGGYFFSAEHVLTLPSIMLNRGLTMIGVWTAVYFALRYRRIEYKEKKHKEQLGALYRNAREGIIFLNEQGEVELSNPYTSKLFAYTQDELHGKSITTILPDHDGKSFLSFLKEFNQEKDLPGNTVEWISGRTRSGKEFPVEITISHSRDGDERATILFIQDITNKKERERLIERSLTDSKKYSSMLEEQVRFRTRELEEALENVKRMNKTLSEEVEVRRKVEKELRKSQHVYAEIARNFPEGVIGVMNKDLNYVFADGEELSALGFADGKVLGKPLFNGATNVLLGDYTEALKRVYDGEKVKFDVPVNSRVYSITSVPLPGEGDSQEALVVIKNVTHRKKVEEELLKTIEKERSLNVLKSRFVTTASHEFRTPLTTILSSASLLEMYKGEQYESKKLNHIARIKRAVNSLTELLNEFLSLGKLEEGKIQSVNVEFSLKGLSDELFSQMELLKKENQEIAVTCKGDTDLVYCDKHLIKNILTNLLSNAIKYSPPGTAIRWDMEVSNERLTLVVRDSGIGIPQAEQSLIFERFFRAQNAADIEGTGLGLNITRKYVHLLNGSISFKSIENKGTTFTVSIPLPQR